MDEPALQDLLMQAAERAADRAVATGTPLRRLHFDLARALRGIPGADEAVDRDPEIIFEPVAAWCRILHAHPSDARDISWGEDSHRDSLVQVLAAWAKVQIVGEGAVPVALADARRAPVVLLGPLARYGPTFVTIAGIAYHLQVYQGEDDILLPVRTLGAELGVHYSRVADHLTMACRHGLLRRTQEHSYAKRKAACYQFGLACPLYLPPTTEPAQMSADAAMRATGATIIDDTGEPLIPARDIYPVPSPTGRRPPGQPSPKVVSGCMSASPAKMTPRCRSDRPSRARRAARRSRRCRRPAGGPAAGAPRPSGG
jgi:hypothetical protein